MKVAIPGRTLPELGLEVKLASNLYVSLREYNKGRLK
jgi:hypothetical protein